MSAHTLGPWRFDGAEVHAHNERVVEFYSLGVPGERIAANGRLIAAAPRMYEALLRLTDVTSLHARGCFSDNLCRAIDDCHAALSEAQDDPIL